MSKPVDSFREDGPLPAQALSLLSYVNTTADRVQELEEENAKLRHVIRQQGSFIIGLKHSIRDFLGNA